MGGYEAVEAFGQLLGGDRSEESQDVERVLVTHAVVCSDAFGDLLHLRHEQGARPGDLCRDAPGVAGVEGLDLLMVTVDERSFETSGSAGGPSAMRAEIGSVAAAPGEGFGHHEVEVDAVGAEPASGVLSGCEPLGGEQVGDQRGVGELGGRDGEVGIGRVFGDGELRGAREVDRLRADEYDGVAVAPEPLMASSSTPRACT